MTNERTTNLIILGATGSIGKSALDVVRRYPDRFRVKALSCRGNTDALAGQVREFSPVCVAVGSDADVSGFGNTRVYKGDKALRTMIRECDADIVLNGIAGAKGLVPSVCAIESGKTLALANKETIVMAGPLVMKLAAERGTAIVPVDSEHSGLFQLIRGAGADRVREITLTASGGAVRKVPMEDLPGLGVEDILNHPTWSMGRKITVDSATGANKGLEVIEAHHLFRMPAERIKVLIHPQSLVHALVRTEDGYLYAQVSEPDMRMAIQNAFFYPAHGESPFGTLDLAGKTLEFLPVDEARYPMIRLGYDALRAGDAAPIVYNAANEVAVDAFFNGAVRFTEIAGIVEKTLAVNRHNLVASMEDVLDIDSRARETASAYVRDRL